MTYTVLGTGAVGGYYGAMLQKGGIEVNFLARSDYDHIKSKGLTIDSPQGDFHLDQVNVYSQSKDLPQADVLLISMKTTTNDSLQELLQPIVKRGTVILVLQNGYGMEQEFQRWFPQAHVMGGMCFICSEKKGPGHIAHLDKGSITLAPMDESGLSMTKMIRDDFNQARVEIQINQDLNHARWSKLLWNIPFNGLSVVLNGNTKEILESPHGYNLARKLIEEVIEGAQKCGVNLDPDSTDKMLHYTKIMIPYEPSMKIDFIHKRKMEIEYIYRRPLEEAEKRGAHLPYIRMLADQLDFLDGQNNS